MEQLPEQERYLLMVLGAERRLNYVPLVRAAVLAAVETGRRLKLGKTRSLDIVTIVSSDMRLLDAPKRADILVCATILYLYR
ncbi:arginine N-methyltransferase 5-like protein [Drosera capensis]